jgi:ADP-ribose pyrophosphatase YjhB (NUDIX family)
LMAMGADCVVTNEGGEVLLVKREDFRVWVVPGGSAEAGESPADCAAREAWEETGIRVAVERLVGVYGTNPDYLSFVYVGRAVGGALTLTNESVDVGFFAPDALPLRLTAIHAERLSAALSVRNGDPGVVRLQTLSWRLRLLLPVGLRLRKVRNWLQGRPEAPIARRAVIARGNWLQGRPEAPIARRAVIARGEFAGEGDPAPVTVEPQPGQFLWETLRTRAAAAVGGPVQVAGVLGTDQDGDALVVRFALRAGRSG